MTDEREVWAYVAHKGGKFAGVIAGTLDLPGRAKPVTVKEAHAWKKEIAKFCGDFVADGFDITRVYDRAEYECLTKPMGVWESTKAPDERCPHTGDLFKTKTSAPGTEPPSAQ